MTPRGTRIWGLLLLISIGAGLATACATKVTTGAFTQVGRLDAELRRGTSSKMDVQRVLGTPKGSGNAILPTDPRPREVWFYDDIELVNAEQVAGVIRANFRQQILFVFFDRGVYDGYMWWSNAGEAKSE
jgi:hypothetical protein